MIPVFTSHYSIGKSILTLSLPEKNKEGGSDSIFSILQENNMQDLFLIENCLTGLPEALSNSESLGINLRFGLTINICNQGHKVVVFAKNTNGVKSLNQIYSAAFSSKDCITESKLKDLWDKENLMLCIPFYDSFIFKNTMNFENCTPELNQFDPVFFLENSNLPFDGLIREKVLKYSSSFKLKTQEVRSIFYKEKSDVDALQTYKCICSKKFGKNTLSKPNLNHFGSDDFCFESYLQPK